MEQLSLRLLGRFSLSHSSAGEISIPSKKGQALVAYLALAPGQRRSRYDLADALWSDRGEEQARHSLRQSILTIHKALGDQSPLVLIAEAEELVLNKDLIAIDVLDFKRLAAAEDSERLEQAVALYGGDLLESLYVRSEGFDEWLVRERARLRDLTVETLARLMNLHAGSDDADRAIKTTERVLALDPLREDAHRMLMRLYDGTGRRSAALRQFQVCEETLRQELDAEPEPETLALYSELRSRTGETSGPLPQPDTAPTTEPKDTVQTERTKADSHGSPPAAGVAQTAAKPAKRRLWLWVVMATVAFVIAAGFIYWGVYLRAPTPVFEIARQDKMDFPLPEKPSIAVLPFENRTGNPDQDNFVDGITEGITTVLSIISEMFVIARSSTLTYKDQPAKPQQVAENLGVRYVLMGSVQQSGEQVRISAQLADALTGQLVWAGQYDREAEDVFALQDEITLEIITALQVEITEGEQERMSLIHGTDNLEAWILAAQGLQLIRRVTKGDNAKARRLYRSAIELDRNYAGAWDGLAWTHLLDARFGWSDSRETSVLRAAELAQKMLALDDTRPRTYALLGQVLLINGDHDQAVALGEKAVALNPNGADVSAMLGLTLTYTGELERSIALLKQAMRLSPYYPDWYRWSLGRAYRLAGRYEEAIAALTAGLDRSLESLAPRVELVAAYSQLRAIKKAQDEATEVLRINPNFSAGEWSRVPPYKDPASAERDLDALHRAGLPQ